MRKLLWLFMVLPFWSQAQLSSFSVEVDRDTVLSGNYIKAVFTMKNTDGKFEAPGFAQFDVVSGPNTSSSMYSINGNTSKTITYSYYLLPKKEGTLFLEEAYLVHRDDESKNLKTDALKIVVLPNPDGIIESKKQEDSNSFFFSWPMESDMNIQRPKPQADPAPSQKRKVKKI
ncbi:MAG: BatD family protein [Saprospiraceae bacterium]|nr:BatD family protein [Saprospiraceae bacterium]